MCFKLDLKYIWLSLFCVYLSGGFSIHLELKMLTCENFFPGMAIAEDCSLQFWTIEPSLDLFADVANARNFEWERKNSFDTGSSKPVSLSPPAVRMSLL
jgi:hypothetical protein